uniref:Uncharacterized protein n=1 Tax=Arundo donax TaxID=35708 RepID=A0A0A9ED14_ARUDO
MCTCLCPSSPPDGRPTCWAAVARSCSPTPSSWLALWPCRSVAAMSRSWRRASSPASGLGSPASLRRYTTPRSRRSQHVASCPPF